MMMRVVLVMLVLVIGACGSDSESSEDDGDDRLPWEKQVDTARDQLLAELAADGFTRDDIDDKCVIAGEWIKEIGAYWNESAFFSDTFFYEVCPDRLTLEQAQCVIDARIADEAECCWAGTLLEIPPLGNGTMLAPSPERCDELGIVFADADAGI